MAKTYEFAEPISETPDKEKIILVTESIEETSTTTLANKEQELADTEKRVVVLKAEIAKIKKDLEIT